ncbi:MULTISPECIES: sigma-70 family RNA polymerase sigma factor [unclassified Sphingopyxis]|jgi:RNA polymerase sigma-70 factor (ECF subfamily)|uniref:sigma-70 family RNA polymerase sigma factor n=1 Tax=unclassified Sphingopyxis TaxID=2614943 RepID=UPI002857F1ED|nr:MULTISPECIES: sigma-70 family RNA polymerase sigma factor [unclassified Sphingopyxis]MDR7059174.1 RNA polymerase sigma-70 factor (ECF subfamily) [Sphingopyxis sp. BE235]MDR7178640.1 RNA polymerase sigma-70 factor (ECF subfamily) [Sphingopyxis sp. BE249]
MIAPVSSAAFETIYRTEHRRILNYLRRRVGPDEATDLAQEVFTRLLGSGPIDRIENPAAYLSRITRNMLIDRARRMRCGSPVFFAFDNGRDAPVRADQTWRIDALDLMQVYRQAVRAMPPKTRRVFLMHRIRRMTYRQVAEEIGISIATVEYHMMRALALCRAAIAEGWA